MQTLHTQLSLLLSERRSFIFQAELRQVEARRLEVQNNWAQHATTPELGTLAVSIPAKQTAVANATTARITGHATARNKFSREA